MFDVMINPFLKPHERNRIILKGLSSTATCSSVAFSFSFEVLLRIEISILRLNRGMKNISLV